MWTGHSTDVVGQIDLSNPVPAAHTRQGHPPTLEKADSRSLWQLLASQPLESSSTTIFSSAGHRHGLNLCISWWMKPTTFQEGDLNSGNPAFALFGLTRTPIQPCQHCNTPSTLFRKDEKDYMSRYGFKITSGNTYKLPFTTRLIDHIDKTLPRMLHLRISSAASPTWFGTAST